MDIKLTSRQEKILQYIAEFIDTHGYGPTIREIGVKFKIQSPNGVAGHLKALEAKGVITRQANKSRTIELAPEYTAERSGLPIAGRVAAGMLTEAVENREYLDLGQMFNRRGTYLLEVTGESMIEAHISDGDYVVVEPRRRATAGDIVIAQTEEGEATMKYFFPEKNRVRLQPANRRMKPIFARNVRIKGVVVGVVRKCG